MNSTISMEELDAWTWEQLGHSEHPDDLVGFALHSQYRLGPIEEALDQAVAVQRNVDAQKLAPGALVQIEEWAQQGQLQAILAATRWRYYGVGCEARTEDALAWLEHGVALGYTTCILHKARMLAVTNSKQAIPIFEEAAWAGEVEAYAYWADNDRQRASELLPIALEAGIPHAQYLEGDRLISERKSPELIEAGFELLRRASMSGSVYACSSLGIKHWYGIGTEVNLQAAEQWFRMAAMRGHARSMSALGLLIGTQGEARRAESLRYLRWSALLQDDVGQYNLGRELASNAESAEGKAEGHSLILQAAEQGNIRAIQAVGWGIFQQPSCIAPAETALRLLAHGVKQGDAESQMLLGCVYSRGLGVDADLVRAHELFHIASLQQHPTAIRLLGQTYLNGDGTQQDVARAIDCFKQAADLKSPEAAYELGRIYLFGNGAAKNPVKAARWLSDAAHLGSTRAKCLLGLMFKHGEGVERNMRSAVRWLREASDEGDATATHALAEITLEGDGVEADAAEGKRLMARAAALGDEDAIAWMREHYPEQPGWLKDMMQGKGMAGSQDGL